MLIPHKDLAALCSYSYKYRTYTIDECEVLLLKRGNTQLIIPRGTEAAEVRFIFKEGGWLDILRDIRVFPWYDKDFGWGHAGFIKGGREIADFLEDKLSKDVPIILIGHSMGASLSLVVMAKLLAKGFKVIERVGFAEPKSQLSKRTWGVKQTIYRYRSDIVPLMPRYTPYRHNIPIVQLSEDVNRKPTWDDHAIELYIESLRHNQA